MCGRDKSGGWLTMGVNADTENWEKTHARILSPNPQQTLYSTNGRTNQRVSTYYCILAAFLVSICGNFSNSALRLCVCQV